MAKQFKQFLEESKQKSAMLRKQKTSSKKLPSSVKPLKVVDSDKPTGAKRLGGGKRITPSNWLKKPNTPDPWAKSKEKKVAPKKEPVKKAAPVQKKISKKPSAADRIKSANKRLNQKIDSVSNLARGAVHAGLERPKQVAHVAGSVLKTTARLAGAVAKHTGSTLSALNKTMHQSKGEFK